MTFDEARSEAVAGARITSLSIQRGAYVDYHFNGLRVNYPSGSNSGFSPTDADFREDWSIVPDSPKEGGWVRPGLYAKREDAPSLASPVSEVKRNKWGQPI